MKKLGLSVLTILVILIFGALWLRHSSSSFTAERAAAYPKIIAFAGKHKAWGDFDIDHLAQLRINDPAFLLDDNLSIECCSAQTYQILGRDTVAEATKMAVLLEQTSTQVMRREGTFYLFYPEQTLLEAGKGRSGYVYSPDGNNPNQAGGKLVERSRPLESMGKGWYRARKIAYGPLN